MEEMKVCREHVCHFRDNSERRNLTFLNVLI